MDHLCELPNDSSRRKALGDLPPTLNATYERILRRVNRSNKDVQLLVSRTLKWIVYYRSPITTAALCEAVAINLEDTRRDVDNISDEFEILRRCSSLVRKSADDDCLELAHFTVKEFLQKIGPEDSGEFAAFRIGPYHGDLELAKTCLTYLSFEDFDQGNFDSKDVIVRRLADFPLRKYAVRAWDKHAREHLHDDELLSLTKQFLNPSKPSTLLSWAHDLAYLRKRSVNEEAKAGIAEASPLHYAAMLGLPEICAWLLEGGCDVDRGTVFGTPLHCALLGTEAFDAHSYNPEPASPMARVTLLLTRGSFRPHGDPNRQSVIEILLKAGADPNRYFETSNGTYTPLLLSFTNRSDPSTVQLLEKGARMDEQCIDLMNKYCRDTPTKLHMGTILHHVKQENVQWEHQSQVLSLRLAADQTQVSEVLETVRSSQLQSLDYGRLLRTAAELGQVEVVSQFLKMPKIDVQAAKETTRLTALHYASMRGHLEVVKLLRSHGAQLDALDHKGKTAIHHAIEGHSFDCLEFLLKESVGDIPPDKDGDSLWHLAAMNRDKQVLEILARYFSPIPRLSEMKNKKGWSPLLSAASVASADNVEWLLHAGCNVMDAASDGSTALHIVTNESGERALPLARFLLGNGCDVNSYRTSGDSPLMIAAKRGITDIMDLLISRGADLKAQDKHGCNVVHFAAENGHVKILQHLRHKGVDWNKRGSCWINNAWRTGFSSLHFAAMDLKPDVMDYLLDEGLVSDINTITDASMTALFIATWFSRPLTVSTLLARNADATIKGLRGENPIEMAARFGNTAVIGAFLQHDRSREFIDDHGLRCELLAMKAGHREAAKMFREHNVKRGKISALT